MADTWPRETGYRIFLARTAIHRRPLPVRLPPRLTRRTRRTRLVPRVRHLRRKQKRKRAFWARYLVYLDQARNLRITRNLNRRAGAEKGARQWVDRLFLPFRWLYPLSDRATRSKSQSATPSRRNLLRPRLPAQLR